MKHLLPALKRSSKALLCLVALMVAFNSCIDVPSSSFSADDLVGEWFCPDMGLYYAFNADGTGRYFDANNDGKNFNWTLDGDALEIKAKGDGINVVAFETYILTFLTDSTMKCHEEGFTTVYTFTRTK